MNDQELHSILCQYFETDEGNHVSAMNAITPEMEGLRLFDAPLLAVADANDPMFRALQSDDVLHRDYPLPEFWLPGAKRVISVFFPFPVSINKTNLRDPEKPSPEWLHARFEGHDFVIKTEKMLCELLKSMGYQAVCPTLDERFMRFNPFLPNWSERHTAFIAGLGTFGMSRGLITERGTAGRLGSVITDCPTLEVTPRPYTDIYEYCTRCGMCAKKCPPHAIDPEKAMNDAKDSTICKPYMLSTKTEPQGKCGRQRYACGKCQTGVPCEHRNPTRR